MKENTIKKWHPRLLPGFEVGYYPAEWVYYDDEEHHSAAVKVNKDTNI